MPGAAWTRGTTCRDSRGGQLIRWTATPSAWSTPGRSAAWSAAIDSNIWRVSSAPPSSARYCSCASSEASPCCSGSPLMSITWVGAAPKTSSSLTPQGSSSSCSRSSRKTHGLSASRTASSVARPVARWSAWLSPQPTCSSQVWVSTTSGRSWRMRRAIWRRASREASSVPSGRSRITRSETPTSSQACRCSSARISAASSGSRLRIPASPAVSSR
ncbi:hypothetical protein BCL67_11345 [Nesterenkonia sandarakina]|uniref:Uncharacterized protein n=1 Tax=Nesterenkonia sandarakina TaxID=272918 RepID=A0A2T0YGF1_9MICC|nr:hypothetical protein BCL67_11345 [Nesterenkonia sandarakina]